MSTQTEQGAAGGPGAAKNAAPEEFQALYDHVITCGKCGFCQPVCPIFRATGREANVARGKVALYRNMLEDRTELGPDTKDAFDNCLLCRACTESCFSAVKTDKVVISFRHAYAGRFGRSMIQRAIFRHLLPRPRLMRGLVRTIWALRKTGLPDLLRRAGVIGMINPKIERAMELREGTPGALLTSRIKRRTPAAPAAAAPLVGYWISCGYNYVLPEVGLATLDVLEALGRRVEMLDNCCCGLAAYGYGAVEEAKDLARENMRRLGDVSRFEAIVSECGSCSGHLKEYAELLADDPEWREKAEAVKAKTRSFSEFVQEKGGLAAAGVVPGGPAGEASDVATIVTYHESCHLGRRYQNVTAQPRQILRSLDGYEFREAAESDSCCGAAGTYGVMHPETSAAIIDRKTGFIEATGATVVATECPSCMMQLSYGLKRAGSDAKVLNISELCAEQVRRSPKARGAS